MHRSVMHRSAPGFALLSVFALAVGSLFFPQGALAQPPADIDDGVVLVDTLSGTTAADKIESCIQLFAAATHPAGVCDARGLAGGDIDALVVLDVEGLTLLLGSGTYDLLNNGGFRLTADGVTLEGEGDATHLDGTAKTGTSAAIDVWHPGGAIVDGASVRNLRITGQFTQTLGNGFTLVRANNTRHTTFESLTLDDVDKSAVNITNSNDAEVDGCTITNATAYGVLVGGTSQRVRVTRNRIARAGLGAAIRSGFGAIAVLGSSTSTVAPSQVHIEENYVEDFGGAGIRVTRVGQNVPSDVAIINNEVDHVAPELINTAEPNATRDGECVATSGNNVQILNNRLNGAYVNGIVIFMNQVGGTIENITIAQNRVSNSSQMPGSTNVHHGVGILLLEGHGSNIVVGDNILFDDQPIPTQGFAVSLNPGTRLPTTVATNLFIHDNVGSGNIQSATVSPAAVAAGVTHGNTP